MSAADAKTAAEVPAEAAAAAAAAAPAAIPLVDQEPEDVMAALAIVMKKSIEVNGLIRGISQVARALDSRTAHLCILADDCEEAQYKKLIAALCAVNNIDLVRVPKREELAEWAGLVKKDRTGTVKKHFKCSCVAIRNFGENSKALEMLLEQIK